MYCLPVSPFSWKAPSRNGSERVYGYWVVKRENKGASMNHTGTNQLREGGHAVIVLRGILGCVGVVHYAVDNCEQVARQTQSLSAQAAQP